MICDYCIMDAPQTLQQLHDRRVVASTISRNGRMHIMPCSECGGTEYFATDRYVAKPLPRLTAPPRMSLRPIFAGMAATALAACALGGLLLLLCGCMPARLDGQPPRSFDQVKPPRDQPWCSTIQPPPRDCA